MKSIKKYALTIQKWVKANRKEAVILFLIVLLGTFFRLYKIADYMTFLGDEGRDALIVRRLLVNFDPILIGPGTSIGNMYLGPLYYYFMAPWLWLANLSPVGPAIAIAVLGIATIVFIWFLAYKWFGIIAANTASLLYAIAPVVIVYSKSSWNPNIMPFFALLCIYAIWQVYKANSYKWLGVLGIAFAFVMQSHYLGLLLIPTIGLFWFLTFIDLKNKQQERINFIKQSFLGFLLFAVLMSPLIIFDARHNWTNFTAIKTFFTQRETTVSIKPWKAFGTVYPIFRDSYITNIVGGMHKLAGGMTTLALVGFVIVCVTTLLASSVVKRQRYTLLFDLDPTFLVIGWIFFGLVGMGLYKQHVYDHYFGFMFPAGFLLVGALAQKVYEKFGDSGKIITISSVSLLVVANLVANPLRYPPNGQMTRALEVAQLIERESGGTRFNLAVIAERNYEDGYQYFLEKNRAKIVEIDAQVPETTTDQLFVVCELTVTPGQEDTVCDPTHNPKSQVANFGWSRVENKWSTSGVTVYKLVHTQN